MKFLRTMWEWSFVRGSNSWFFTRMALLGLIILGLWVTWSTSLVLVPILGLGIVLFEGFGFGRTPLRRWGHVR